MSHTVEFPPPHDDSLFPVGNDDPEFEQSDELDDQVYEFVEHYCTIGVTVAGSTMATAAGLTICRSVPYSIIPGVVRNSLTPAHPPNTVGYLLIAS